MTLDNILEEIDNLPKPIYEIVKPTMDLDKIKIIALLLLKKEGFI